MAYPLIMPFLRGLYLTMNSRKKKRYRDGWKSSKQAYDLFINDGRRQGHIGYYSGSREEDREPKMIKEVGVLFKHFSALVELFKQDEPALRLIRVSEILEVLYIFGDSSGLGFGSSWTEGRSIGYRFGVWNEEGYGTGSN